MKCAFYLPLYSKNLITSLLFAADGRKRGKHDADSSGEFFWDQNFAALCRNNPGLLLLPHCITSFVLTVICRLFDRGCDPRGRLSKTVTNVEMYSQKPRGVLMQTHHSHESISKSSRFDTWEGNWALTMWMLVMWPDLLFPVCVPWSSSTEFLLDSL